MTALTVVQLVVFFGLLLLITRPLGSYMARVFAGEKTFLHRGLGWLERGTYRLLRGILLRLGVAEQHQHPVAE